MDSRFVNRIMVAVVVSIVCLVVRQVLYTVM